MSKQTLILLYGGRSAEREVSVLSAESVMRAVDYSAFEVKTYFITQSGDFIKTQEFTETPGDDEKLMTNDTVVASQAIKPSDIYEAGAVVFPVLHGPMGEDGSIQGFLETLKLPYVGTNVLSSSVAMDKIMTKHILEVAGVPQVAYTVFIEGEDLEAAVAETLEKLTFPVFVKPANMGSSVGISKAENEAELRAAIDLALKYDSRILIEQGVVAREIEVGILGNTNVKTTDPGEVVKDVAFYDYQAKYIDNKITMDIPAHVPAEVMTQMRAYAAKAFCTTGMCRLVERAGMCVDVVSGGELYTALAAGFPPERIEFNGNNKLPAVLRNGLSDINVWLWQILQAEVSGEAVPAQSLCGMNAEAIRLVSHDPMKYLGQGHIVPDVALGPNVALLNWLRAQAREVEVAYVQVGMEREDILASLNRLSSAIYVLMLLTVVAESGRDISKVGL